MTVDIKLNEMIDALDPLASIRLEDVELRVRAYKALKNCGAKTLADARRVLADGSFKAECGIGRRTIEEVKEIIANIEAMPVHTRPASHVLTEEDTEVDALRWERERLRDRINELNTTAGEQRVEIDRLHTLLLRERAYKDAANQRVHLLAGAMSVADLRRLGVTVNVDFDTAED